MVTVKAIQTEASGEYCRISAEIKTGHINREPETLWFRFPRKFSPETITGDPFAAAFLAPCMAAGIDLFIDAPLTPSMNRAIPKMQDILTGWYPGLSRIAVRHTGITDPPGFIRKDRGLGIFFSGGVDSTFSTLAYETKPDCAIYVHGFENPVFRNDLLRTARTSVTALARHFGMEVLEVHTNLRGLADQNISPFRKRYRGIFFGDCYMGSMLAAAGLCLGDHFHTLVIPASLSEDGLRPYGSHPEIDPLWSTSGIRFIHHGVQYTRFKKIKSIVETAPALLAYLQVCERSIAGEINCCRCEKCIRTMMALDIIGWEDNRSSFHRPFNPRGIIGRSNRKKWENEYRELLHEAVKGRRMETQKVLESVLGEKITTDFIRDRVLSTLKSVTQKFLPRLQHLYMGKRAKNWNSNQ